MNNQKITILTDPAPRGEFFISEYFKLFLKSIRRKVLKPKSFYYGSKYGGHTAVTRSLINGLELCKANFDYNPKDISLFSDVVVVLAGVKTLKQAIKLKKKGYIKKIFAGPNISVFTSDYNFLLASPEIDLIIVPSEWVKIVYLEDSPLLNDKIFVWPAGVDLNFWSLKKDKPRDRILVYDKTDASDNENINLYLNFLNESSLNFDILKCSMNNPYTSEQYRDLLNRVNLMIGFSGGSESQGIAWAEAWAMNVPTLIKAKSSNIISGRSVMSSTAPYLCSSTGLFFDDINDFKEKINFSLNNLQMFCPREWVTNNMSDELSASKLFDRIKQC